MAFEQSLLLEIPSIKDTIITDVGNELLSPPLIQRRQVWQAEFNRLKNGDLPTHTEQLKQISENIPIQREAARTNLASVITEEKKNIPKINDNLAKEQNTANEIDQILKTIREIQQEIFILQSQSDPLSQSKLSELEANLIDLQIQSSPAKLDANRKKIESINNEKNAQETKLRQLNENLTWLDSPAGTPEPDVIFPALKSYKDTLDAYNRADDQLKITQKDIARAEERLGKVNIGIRTKQLEHRQFLLSFIEKLEKIHQAEITEQQLNIIHQELLNMLASKAITNQAIKDSIKRLCDFRLAYRDLRLSAAADHLCFSGFDQNGKVIIPTQAQIDKANSQFLSSPNIVFKKGGIFVRGSNPQEIEKAIAYAVSKLGWTAVTITATDGKQQTVDAAAKIAIRMGIKVVGIPGAEKALHTILEERANLPPEIKTGSITDSAHNELARLYTACEKNMDPKRTAQTAMLKTLDPDQIASMLCNLSDAKQQNDAFNLLASILSKRPASVRHKHLKALLEHGGEESYSKLAVKLLPKISNAVSRADYFKRRAAENALNQLFPEEIPVSATVQAKLMAAAGGDNAPSLLREKLTETFPIKHTPANR